MSYNVHTAVFILNRPVGSATPTIGIKAIDFFNPGVVPIIQLDCIGLDFGLDLNEFFENNNTDEQNGFSNYESEFKNYISDEDFTFDRYEWNTIDNTVDDSDWNYNSS